MTQVAASAPELEPRVAPKSRAHALAIEQLDVAEAAWVAAGRPIEGVGANGQEVVNVLYRALQSAIRCEAAIRRADNPLVAGRRAASAPDRVAAALPSRVAKLKAV